jgi:hypothetical protein
MTDEVERWRNEYLVQCRQTDALADERDTLRTQNTELQGLAENNIAVLHELAALLGHREGEATWGWGQVYHEVAELQAEVARAALPPACNCGASAHRKGQHTKECPQFGGPITSPS